MLEEPEPFWCEECKAYHQLLPGERPIDLPCVAEKLLAFAELPPPFDLEIMKQASETLIALVGAMTDAFNQYAKESFPRRCDHPQGG